jgi:hypothetical protein
MVVVSNNKIDMNNNERELQDRLKKGRQSVPKRVFYGKWVINIHRCLKTMEYYFVVDDKDNTNYDGRSGIWMEFNKNWRIGLDKTKKMIDLYKKKGSI